MLIKKEHLDYLEIKIAACLSEDGNSSVVYNYEHGLFPRSDKVKDLQKRFCFDVMGVAVPRKFICDELYSYLSNDHLYTALKRICPKLTKRY